MHKISYNVFRLVVKLKLIIIENLNLILFNKLGSAIKNGFQILFYITYLCMGMYIYLEVTYAVVFKYICLKSLGIFFVATTLYEYPTLLLKFFIK